MKRTGLIVALLIVTAGFAAAQEDQKFDSTTVKQKGGFSGYVYSKIQLSVWDQDGNGSWGPNWWSSGYNHGGSDFAFGLDLTGENKGLHMEGAFSNTEFFVNNLTTGSDPSTLANTYGSRLSAFYYWADLVPEELRAKLGFVADSTYKKERADHTGVGSFSGWGVFANYTPKWSKDVLGGAFGIGAFYPVAFGKNTKDMANWSVGNSYDFYPAQDSVQEIGVAASYTLAAVVKLYAGTIGGGAVSYKGANDTTSTEYTANGLAHAVSTHFKRKYFGTIELLQGGFSNTFYQLAYTSESAANANDGWYQSLLSANYTLDPWKFSATFLDKIHPAAGATPDYQDWEVVLTPTYTKIFDFFDFATAVTVAGKTGKQQVDTAGNEYLSIKVNPNVTFPDLSFLNVGFNYTRYTSELVTDRWDVNVALDIWLGF